MASGAIDLREFQRWGEDTQNEINQQRIQKDRDISLGLQKIIQKIGADDGYTLIVEKNEEALKTIEIAADPVECCLRLKAEVISRALVKYGWEALIVAARRDEQQDRTEESYFSPRDNPPHVRVHPILHFTELDIWAYIKAKDVPFCSLYRKGYRSLGCEPCTQMGRGQGPERAGRSAQKEEMIWWPQPGGSLCSPRMAGTRTSTRG